MRSIAWRLRNAPGGIGVVLAALTLLPGSSPGVERLLARGPMVSAPVAPSDGRDLPAASATAPGAGSDVPREAVAPGLADPAAGGSGAAVADAAVQRDAGPLAMPSPTRSFEGMSGTGVYPPDTDGQVGPHHFVQMVNDLAGARVLVLTKSGRTLHEFVLGQLWPPGDPCRELAAGDPVVVYDQLADRWLLTEFAFDRDTAAPPYYECIAVSRDAQPTDRPADWFAYTFRVHDSKLNDYPKFGVWPDGYYMSANLFAAPDFQYAGAGVFVFDRAAMLAGLPATFQFFDLQASDPYLFSLLPSNLMGTTPPPSGSPNYLAAVRTYSGGNGPEDAHADEAAAGLPIFEFHVDWASPANSTFALVTELQPDPFEWRLCDAQRLRCVDQPLGAPRLEALSDRLMMHLWYRNVGDHGSLVANHTVDVGGGIAGIRWYEIRGGFGGVMSFADARIHQQGTFGPADGTHRWMGSLAMDRFGNLALGYSLSNGSDVYPSIRYAGRRASDPPGLLPLAEVTLVDGSGVQTGPAARWGDYSAMSVDPADDCTFWYTQEYYQTTAPVNWQTRIGSFRFDDCAPVAAAPTLPRMGSALGLMALVGVALARYRRGAWRG